MATDDDIDNMADEYALKESFEESGDERRAYNDIDIQNKLIEPDDRLSELLATSNFQLGNIKESDYYGNIHEVNFAIDCLNTPFDKGGWLLHEIGLNIFKKLDIAHIMSGSKNAKKWDSLTTQNKNITMRREKKKTGIIERYKKK